MTQNFHFFPEHKYAIWALRNESLDNLQFNDVYIFFISDVLSEFFKFYGKHPKFHYFSKKKLFHPKTSNFFTKITEVILFNMLNKNPSSKIF